MNKKRTVLVLTPILGGFYFGELLASLTKAVSAGGGRLVIVKTLHQAPSDDSQAPGHFAIPVAWSQVDGVVSIHSAVEASYLHQLRDAGRPVVLLGGMTKGIDAPAVMPDNRTGTTMAVEHLIGHGHTRIGFVGNLSHRDIRDRLSAYQETLAAHDLALDPSLMFDAPDNMEAGGRAVARELLTHPHRPTAIMVATDRNAMGLMSVLTDAGLTLPEDLAIVAFDDIESSKFTVPSLSSTSQRFDELGSLAGHLILAAIRGDAVPNAVFTPNSVVLTVRTSCGCCDGLLADDHPMGVVPATIAGLREPDDFARELAVGLADAKASLNEPARDAATAAVRFVDRLIEANAEATDAELRALVLLIHRMAPRADAVHRTIGAVLDHIDRISLTGVDAATIASIRVALWKAKAGEFLQQLEAKELAFTEQYVVDAGMLGAARSKPHSLEWLGGTHVKAGALALWTQAESDASLEVVGAFAPGCELPDLVGTHTSPESFPPAPLLDLLVPEDRDICVVVPVRTATRDWGLLAMVGAVDSAAIRETYRHWAGMLGAALESQRLEAEVRKSALYDALTGLPNRRLFLERLTAAVNRTKRSGAPFAVLFLDLDGFKLINDSRGHQMGDRVLAAVGDRIGSEIRTVDTGSRLGGDEFAIILEDTDDPGALLVAQRVQSSLSEPIALEGSEVSVRASLGIATSGMGLAHGEEILRAADLAMYRAKSQESGSIVFFTEPAQA